MFLLYRPGILKSYCSSKHEEKIRKMLHLWKYRKSCYKVLIRIEIFLNQLFAYQAIRVENDLIKNETINYESLVTIQPEDFKYFCVDDFINIIGDENVKLFKI